MTSVTILPDIIIAGAPKSGTSSLFTWLADHPQVQGSTEKETYFLVDPGTHCTGLRTMSPKDWPGTVDSSTRKDFEPA